MSRWEAYTLDDRYAEDRWSRKYPEFCDDFNEGVCLEYRAGHDLDGDDAERFSRLQCRADGIFTAAPTVVLVGMYLAAMFSIFALGHPLLGFLLGAGTASGIALWAFSGD